jgi:CRP/FNR family transcriptional regulator, cyclic AMP receptor protein
MTNLARAIFQNNELLQHLDSTGVDRVARLATRRSYDHGATIFAEGDAADAIYGVIAGQVQISARTSSHEEIFLDAYGSGKIFGLISGIDGLLRCTTARAAPAAEVFVLCREHFLRLIAAEPLLTMGLLAVFCQRQRITTRLIVGEYAQRDIPARLAHRVLELTGTDASSQSCLAITQAELAKFVFVSRQVVNQYLSEWQGRGWVATSPRHLRVTDRQALAAVAASGAGVQ